MRSDSEEVRHKKTNRQKRSVCFFERSPAHQGKLGGKIQSSNKKVRVTSAGRPAPAEAAGAAANITKHYKIMHSLFNAISV